MLSWYLLFQYWIGSNEGIDAANQNAGIDGHPANGIAGFIPPKIIASHRNAHVQNINEKLHEMPISSQLTGLPGENLFAPLANQNNGPNLGANQRLISKHHSQMRKDDKSRI